MISDKTIKDIIEIYDHAVRETWLNLSLGIWTFDDWEVREIWEMLEEYDEKKYQ